MARGSLAKVRWRNDRIRKTKERRRRQRAAGRQQPTATPTDTVGTSPTP